SLPISCRRLSGGNARPREAAWCAGSQKRPSALRVRPDGFRRGHDSEYPAVVIPVAMLQRNLLYTGVTRGKRLVVLVGQKKAVAIAVRNVSGRRRWSKLGEWLASGNRSTPGHSSKP